MPIEPYLVSREALTAWIYQIHNKVNASIKPAKSNIPQKSKAEIDKIYEQKRKTEAIKQ